MPEATRILAIALSTFVLFTLTSSAQIVRFDSSAWQMEGADHHLMDYHGKAALFLKGASAELETPDFLNGEIEFDIAFSAERGFSGVQWRIVNDANGEIFYFRPHLSGMPDANQYTPVDNGVTAWQLLHGPAYSSPIRYRRNEWQHVRIVFSGRLADIYVDSNEPVLTVKLKRDPQPGNVAVYASSFAPAYFANFQYRISDEVETVGTPAEIEAAEPGTVTWWEVSSAFAEDSLAGADRLAEDFTADLTWNSLAAYEDGVSNLARVAKASEGRNTVLARVNIRSESARTETVRFGYSDRVRVYLNGTFLYAGDNSYRTRDYRYLGTIGLFDEVPLRLSSGENELLFAVSEDFGGWGLIARFQNPDTVSLMSAW